MGNTQQNKKKKAKISTSKKVGTSKKKKSVKSSKGKKKAKKSNAKRNSRVVRKKNITTLNIETADLSKLLQSNNITAPKLDTVPEKEVSIISAFKPQLKNIAKLNFTKATNKPDTSTTVLNYQVPTQNLSFQYRPISLIPRSYKEKETSFPVNTTNLKVGFGNYNNQFFEARYNAVDENKHSHAFEASFETSNGMQYLQQFNHKNFAYIGNIKLNDNHSIQAEAFYQNTQRYRFGLVADNSSLSLAEYSQAFTNFGTSLKWVNEGSQNTLLNKLFNPILRFENFKGLSTTNNLSVELYNPMSFTLKGTGKINLDFNYNYNKYTHTNYANQTNSIFTVQPTIELNKWNSSIKVGFKPSFTTNEFALFPVVQFSKKLNDTNYLLVANWQTILTNNNYANLSMTNPWIAAPTTLKITTQEKKELTLFINASKNFQYNFGLSLNDYRNIPFFNRINNVAKSQFFGLQFQPIFEYRAITLEFVTALRYQFNDQFIVKGNAKYIQFNSIKENTNAWGILPLNLNGDLSWYPSKKWSIDGSMQYWSGASFQNAAENAYDLKNTLVLNASFNYQLTTHLKAWAKAENLLDKKYQRWAEYPSLGVQLIAGIVYSFHK
jgi:outer membrane receptor protein involved in Fe transport